MKTITKTFYVSDGFMEQIKHNSVGLRLTRDPLYINQIQISWQEPERKIEITESEFDEAVKYADKNHHRISSGEKYMDILKQKLFGASDE